MLLTKILIGLLVTITPFFALPGQDTREPKIYLALIGAVAVILSVFYYGMFKPVRNKWLLIFLAYFPISILLFPVSNLWGWKSYLFLAVFSFFIISVSSIDFETKDVLLLLKTMMWCGFVLSLYMILQFLGIDQFYYLLPQPASSVLPSARVGGTMGHPTLISPFVAMLIPLAIYFKKHILALTMIIAVVLTKSQVGIGAMCLSLLFIIAFKNKAFFITLLALIVLSGSGIAYLYKTKPEIIKKIIVDNGRFKMWGEAIQDMNKPALANSKKAYPYTGFGPGSFYYIFHLKHKTPDVNLQAHNEYIELLYDSGMLGLVLILTAIFFLLKDNIKFPINRQRKYLLASFICIAVSAGGTFVWHLGPHIIYSCIIVGLLAKPITLT